MKTKIMFLAPHLSTGGMPQFLLKRIELLNNVYDIYVAEFKCVSGDFVVQRNKIIELIGKDNFFENVGNEFLEVLKTVQPDILHIENEAEGFPFSIMCEVYDHNRNYKIVETCHNVTFKSDDKFFIPDAFAFCTSYHYKTFNDIDCYKSVIEYPFVSPKLLNDLDTTGFPKDKINVLNVGLWTSNKNQSEGLEIARENPHAHFHFVGNRAVNFSDYWKPLMENIPDNVTVWDERDDISRFMQICDIFMFNSKLECNPLVLREAISHNMPIYAHNLPQYDGQYDEYILPIELIFKQDKKYKVNYTENNFYSNSINFYSSLLRNENKKEHSRFEIRKHFVDGGFLEIIGNSKSNFKVEFFDQESLVYRSVIKCNSWVKLNRKYYTNYRVKVWEIKDSELEKLVLDEQLSLEGKRVMINFESSSLGDTLAWLPYCDEFQKKHNCILFVSTFKNFLFENQYDNIVFKGRGEVIPNLYAKYDLGWFYDINKEPVLPNTIPLQKTATNILGLNFSEIKPKLNFNSKVVNSSEAKKYVCIAPDSTAGCKEWDLENWQKLVNHLINDGYEIINVSIDSKYNLKNVFSPENLSLEATMQIIYFSEFFIGLSSGLSWLAWSLNKHVYMIANFTTPDHEFQNNCTRITKKEACNGCWNNKNFKFDKGNWNWCPIWEGYEKQFECQKSISVEDVVEKIAINNKKRVRN